ncbi:MAG: enoyl-CoA hydratase/isomerase family protein [Undibacterium sp.]|nr:enoyl-CoA hydratase/isomerase family protein [Undibacterium sp.]
MSAVRQNDDDIAIISIDYPPVNGLGWAVRSAIAAYLQAALDDPAIKAIILTGSGKIFSGGADIKEFSSELAYREPSLSQLITQIENSHKPIVAAIIGVCMGGGLELALACHYRLAAQGAAIALPEVKLGLLPGAGGTQRLPRLIGVELAVEMITTGKTQFAEQFINGTLFELDCIEPQSLLEYAKTYARQMADKRPIPRVSAKLVAPPQDPEFFSQKSLSLAKKMRGFPAPLACLAAIEASLLQTFELGLQMERALFQRLIQGDESKSLRHVFMAERAAGKIAGVEVNTSLRQIQTVAVIGAGNMGVGIAMSFANAGIPVQIFDLQTSALEKALVKIRENYEKTVKQSKLSSKQLEQRCALISAANRYQEIANADLVIEAVFEEMSVKENVFKQLDTVMKQGAILASNTSTLDLNQIASFTKRPQDVIGLHFFSPAHVMELLEIVRGGATSVEVLATCSALAKKIKKVAVVSGVCDGFIGNRMLAQYTKQAAFLLEEGCTPEQVDKAIEAFGFAMGPFRMSDLAGNDVSWAIRKHRRQIDPTVVYSRLGDLLCEQGRFGQKTKAGWYDYHEQDRTALPSETVAQLIKQHAQELQVEQRVIADEEIVQRLVFALVNEGAKILHEGIASRASDIDLVYVKGYGFPAFRGGPMYYAQNLGWDKIAAVIGQFAQGYRGNTWVLSVNGII